MTRWCVIFDLPYVEAETAKEAVERALLDFAIDYQIDYRGVAIDMDAIEGSGLIQHFRIGAQEIEAGS